MIETATLGQSAVAGMTVTGEGSRRFEDFMRRATPGQQENFLQIIKTRFMPKQAVLMASHVVRTQLSGRGMKSAYTPTAHKQVKGRRSGSLARSIHGEAVMLHGLPAVEVGIFRGPALKYAGPQELGTKSYNPDSPYQDITPKNAKALAVPVGKQSGRDKSGKFTAAKGGDAMTPAGVSKYSSPREYPEELAFIPSRRGNLVGWLVLADDLRREQESASKDDRKVDLSQVTKVYMLILKAKIRPGFFISDGVQDYMPKFSTALADFIIAEVVP